MMTTGVLVLTAGRSDEPIRPWIGADVALGILTGDGPSAAAWRRRHDLTHVVVMAHPRAARRARGIATVVAADSPWVSATCLLSTASSVAQASAALRALQAGVAPPLAHRAIRDALEAAPSGAWLQRLTRLDQPRPSFWQHISSIFVGGYLVDLSGPGRVLKRGSTLTRDEGVELLVGAAADSAHFRSLTEALPGSVAPAAVPQVGDPAGLYGTKGAEFAVVEPLPLPEPVGVCDSCREPVADVICPFCRVVCDQESVR